MFAAGSFLLLGILQTNAQQTSKQFEPCIAEIMFQEEAAKNPQMLIDREQQEVAIAAYIAAHPEYRISAVPKVIPVVFHVIHAGGTENISKAQILSQMVSLNNDMRRLNADTVNTPAPFKPLGADTNIEFRLATKDPNGNCTDGIKRVFSPLTANARNNVKALSYWPSDKYLNIWVVQSIENVNGTPGTVIGFAQFPGTTANPLTDGVVLASTYTGTIGTSVGNNNAGRTATHEVGHWLNLRHIWGDASCGDDQVNDTPQQAGANQSNCPAFPKVSACPLNGAYGDMFTNYMDYTRGTCQNMFSIGQGQRIDAALNSPTSGRSNLWSASNRLATGTQDGAPVANCLMVPDFYSNFDGVCQGGSITFTDGSFNGDATAWSWTFPGGTPSSSNAQNPVVVYSTPGTYDVTLSVTSAGGTAALTKNNFVKIDATNGAFGAPFTQGFETISVPNNDWSATNEGGNGWEVTNAAKYSGTYSVRINNFGGNTQNSKDVLYTPSVNLSNVSATMLKFKMAFAVRSTVSTDKLSVWATTTCGQFWAQRYAVTGTALSTGGLVTSNFVPTSTVDWREETINLASTSYSGKPNVAFKFEYTHDTGNNIYIDDINIDGIVGIEDGENYVHNLSLFPNPSATISTLEFSLINSAHVVVKLYDLLGRELSTIADTELEAGDYQKEIVRPESAGVYFVKVFINGAPIVRKLIVN